MPRQCRQRGFTGVYHVMMRGNEKKDIFIDNEDKYKFLDILYNKKQISGFDLYAYCLMSNHIHLIIKENTEDLSACLKRINISYAYYFNKKYNTVGHLFHDRYKSECINSQSYLLAALSYVHNNPVKAGITFHISDYKWSSYNIYIEKSFTQHFIDKDEILEMFSKDRKKAMINFINFSNKKCEDTFIDVDNNDPVVVRAITLHGISQAKEYINQFLIEHGLSSESIRDRCNSTYRDSLIKYLKIHSNLSLREIGSTLNISKTTIDKINT